MSLRIETIQDVAGHYLDWIHTQEGNWRKNMQDYVEKHDGTWDQNSENGMIHWNGDLKNFSPPPKPDTSFQVFIDDIMDSMFNRELTERGDNRELTRSN